MTLLLDHARTIGLLKTLACELGWRAREDYDQLFSVDTVSRIYSLISEMKKTIPVFSDESLRRMLHHELVEILTGMGTKLSDNENVRDNVRNLTAVRDVIAEINDDANRGVFIEHELTWLTATIKAKLTRRIECLRMVRESHLEQKEY